MLTNGYEILGVAQDATPEEIKRAYFKLIRHHTPEKDPEGFKKIHAAYEAVLSGEMLGRPDFPEGNEEEKRLIQQLQDYIDHRQFAMARDMGEKIIKKQPQLDHVRYLVGIAQRECGNCIKSSNNFLKLLEKYPEDKWLEREACISYYERGWKNKGYEIGQEAYVHGCLDIRFIKSFLECIYAVGSWEDRNIIVVDLVNSSPRWNRDNFHDGITIFNHVEIFMMESQRYSLVKGLGDFLGQLGNVLEKNTDWLAKKMDYFLDSSDEEQDRIAVPYYNKLISMSKSRYISNGLLEKYPRALDTVLRKEKYPVAFRKAVEAYNSLLYSGNVRLVRKKNEENIQNKYNSIIIACIEGRAFLGEHAQELKGLIPDIWKDKSKFFEAMGDESISNEELCKLV